MIDDGDAHLPEPTSHDDRVAPPFTAAELWEAQRQEDDRVWEKLIQEVKASMIRHAVESLRALREKPEDPS